MCISVFLPVPLQPTHLQYVCRVTCSMFWSVMESRISVLKSMLPSDMIAILVYKSALDEIPTQITQGHISQNASLSCKQHVTAHVVLEVPNPNLVSSLRIHSIPHNLSWLMPPYRDPSRTLSFFLSLTPAHSALVILPLSYFNSLLFPLMAS